MLFLQIEGNLWIANVGDSRALLIDPDGKVIQLSEDAKPTDDRYEASIVKRGGEVSCGRVNLYLGVARSLGEYNIFGVSARPKIVKVEEPLSGWEDHKAVQACDGIFEVTNSDIAGEFVHQSLARQASDAAIAGQLVELAYEAGSNDNLSVIVTSLGNSEKASAD